MLPAPAERPGLAPGQGVHCLNALRCVGGESWATKHSFGLSI